MKVQNQIIYFPYLSFKYSPIKFGDMVLWNFDQEKDKMIADVQLRVYVDKLLKANVTHGRPIQDMAIFSENPPTFQPNDSKMRLTEELRCVLFLCVMANRNIYQGENSGHFMATSENFTHIFQNFILGGEFTAFSAGSIVRINNGGYEVGKVRYEKPPYVLQGNYRMDEKLLSSLITLKRRNIEAYRIILKATGAFMSGYFNSDELSFETRILQQSRAFEVLLQLPERDQRMVFKDKIRFYCFPREKKFQREFRYLSERTGGRTASEKNIMAVIWADRFYTLRNHIIHGETIKQGDFLFKKQAHWHISLWIYLVIVKKIINESMPPTRFYDELLWKEGQFCYEKGDLYAIIQKNWKKYDKRLKKAVNP